MDSQETAKAVQEGSKALGKFTELVRDFFSPSKTKRQANADAYAICTVSQAIRDNPDMDIVSEDGRLNIRKASPSALLHRAEQKRLVEDCRHEENLENILKITAEEVQSFKDVSDEPVNKDWLARFFSIAQDISDEDMQNLWGRILADEIKKPRSFSLRTLERVRNIDRSDAEIFQKLIPLSIKNGPNFFIPVCQELLEKYDIEYSDILSMDDCGFINSRGTVSIQLPVSVDNPGILCTKDRLLRIDTTDKVEYKVKCNIYALTNASIELIKTIDYACNSDYFIEFSEWLYKKNKNDKLLFKVYKVNQMDENGINYALKPLVVYGE